MTYELRALTAKDVFSLFSILGKIGVKDIGRELKGINLGAVMEDGGDEESVGYEAAFTVAGLIAENLHKAEADVFKFLGDVSGLGLRAVQNLSPADFFDLLIEVVQMPDFKEVFTRASRLKK